MSNSDILLGYDAREAWLSARETWSIERWSRFLLRESVEKPLSVDSDVWPSAFDLVPELTRPDWTGYVQDLWDNLPKLRATLESAPATRMREINFIAVELLASSCTEAWLANWRDRVREVTPPGLHQIQHSLIGYDIADYFLLSGLMNCAPNGERPSGTQWASLLNRHHLFSDPEVALHFRDALDQGVPTHSPFFVFALWKLDE